MLAFSERGGATLNLEDRQAFDHGLTIRPRRDMVESDCGAVRCTEAGWARDTMMKLIEAPVLEYKKLTAA
jgi:hypothetical protein